MRPDEIEAGRFGELGVGAGVGSVETAFQVSGETGNCEFPTNVPTGATPGHWVEYGGRTEESQQVFDEVSATIAGVAAAPVVAGAARMVKAGEMGNGAGVAGRCRKSRVNGCGQRGASG